MYVSHSLKRSSRKSDLGKQIYACIATNGTYENSEYPAKTHFDLFC